LLNTAVAQSLEVRIIDRFVTPRWCETILEELDYAFWSPSTVVKVDSDSTRVLLSKHRVSKSTDETWLTPVARREVRRLGERLSKLIPEFEPRRERWQITRYEKGDAFSYHFDSGPLWASTAAGDRELTALVFLDTPKLGGGTHFLCPDLEIEALAGRLVLWRNLTHAGTRCEAALHAGLPVQQGRKTVLVTWVRQRRLS
jgi:prolyl 4-hydroxylase